MNAPSRSLRWTVLLLSALAGCSDNPPGEPIVKPDAGQNPDGGVGPGDGSAPGDGATNDLTTPVDTGPPPVCTDTDGDGLSDDAEGGMLVDTDRDGTPDFRDTDSDNDGYPDMQEANRSYAMYSMPQRLVCGGSGDNCDAAMVGSDTIPNYRDLDSDNDGLTDREEMGAGTNPCAADTDGDGATDLVVRAAMSNPRDRMSGPPANSLYVILPYHPPGDMSPHEHRQFTFATRIRQADVFFLVDNSNSMEPIINNLRMNFSSVIVPGVRMQIPDVRMGVGSFDSMPVFPQGCGGGSNPPTRDCPNPMRLAGDYTLWLRQPITTDVAAVQRAFDGMRTISQDTDSFFVGGDEPECQTEAAYEVIEGSGSRGHESDAAALRSVRNARDPMGNGWVPRVDPARDCNATATDPRYGWGCFAEGRVPILVLASDSRWYDGCAPGSPATPGNPGHNCTELVGALNRRGGFFIGVDVGDINLNMGSADYNPGATWANARVVSTMTRTIDSTGEAIVFRPGVSGISAASANIVTAITRVATQAPQNITRRWLPDAMASGLPTGRTTADFIKLITPLSAMPDMPTGYSRRDMTTFYDVTPSTRVVFDVDFYNDFMEGGTTARLFQATIEVLGRSNTVVDTRPVYIVVPARGADVIAPG